MMASYGVEIGRFTIAGHGNLRKAGFPYLRIKVSVQSETGATGSSCLIVELVLHELVVVVELGQLVDQAVPLGVEALQAAQLGGIGA